MSLDPYLYFDGNCREALAFYAAVFRAEPQGVMTFGDQPGADPASPDADRVLHASLPVFGANVMFSDCYGGFPNHQGNNITLSVGVSDRAEAERVFTALADGGEVTMPLGPQFFSPLFGSLTDRFGIPWMINLTA
ncbi:MAG: VOC family protein [Propionibacteriaceae bacterium]|jgi:PhnB protein|nr:VOC family protein [Propionibacteriaceae bacterium]